MKPNPAYQEIHRRLSGLVEGVPDEVAVMATLACELFHGIERFDWVGFYRVTRPGILTVGPYQGGHGCLSIPFDKGVCGRCAREGVTQIVPDVRKLEYHIACSSSTLSEIVVPVRDAAGAVRAVLDIDSDNLGAFDQADGLALESLCRLLTPLYGVAPESPQLRQP